MGSRKKQANPHVVTFVGNPPRELIGAAVQAILYRHAADNKEYVHIFGGAEPELIEIDGAEYLRVDRLPLRTGVELFAIGNELLVRHKSGAPLSQEF